MKRYLNRQEREEVFTIAALTGFLETVIKNYTEYSKKVNGRLMQGLKLCRTWGLKAIDEYFKNLDDAERRQVIKEMRKLDVVIKNTKEAQLERKKIAEDSAYSQVVTEDLYEICGQAWAGYCKTCILAPSTEKNCNIWPLFHKYGFPVIDEEAPEGRCPYKMNT